MIAQVCAKVLNLREKDMFCSLVKFRMQITFFETLTKQNYFIFEVVLIFVNLLLSLSPEKERDQQSLRFLNIKFAGYKILLVAYSRRILEGNEKCIRSLNVAAWDLFK